MDELKPCPFCGCNEIIGNQYINRDMQDCYAIYCSNCDATIRGYTESEVIEAWNTRHDPDELPEWVKEAIEKAFEETGYLYRDIDDDGSLYAMLRQEILTLRKPEP